MTAATLAYLGAIGIAMMSSLFGVGIARLLWANDLKFAQQIETRRKEIDVIRDQTESSLRKTIEIQEGTIVTLRGNK